MTAPLGSATGMDWEDDWLYRLIVSMRPVGAGGSHQAAAASVQAKRKRVKFTGLGEVPFSPQNRRDVEVKE